MSSGDTLTTQEKSAYAFVNNRRDQQKRPVSDESYDQSTLYIPQSQLESMKKMERQYWDIKRNNFDVVVFFKKGKFYELYDTDAEIGSREFGLRMVSDARSTGMMMSGVPEQSFTMWSQRFIARGYKVGRVEQMARQSAKPSDFMHRELVRVYSTATLSDTEFIQTSDALYVVAIFENIQAGEAQLGACAIDCSRSKGYYSIFEGPERFLQLKTFLYHLSPREIVVPQYAFISRELNNIVHEHKSTECFLRQMYVSEEVSGQRKEQLLRSVQENAAAGSQEWISTLENQPDIVVMAFALISMYLTKLHIAKEVLNSHLSLEYFSVESDTATHSSNHMILDCHTLQHLNIVPIETKASQHTSGKSKHRTVRSLFTRIDCTRTSAGKRLLKSWVLNPLRVYDELTKRQECVRAVMSFNTTNESVLQMLRKCPNKDLERSSWKLRAMADEKNVMWVDPKQQGKKIQELLGVTLALASSYNTIAEKVIYSAEVSGTAMGKHLANILPQALQGELDSFSAAYLSTPNDNKPTFYDGFLVPSPGADESFDAIEQQMISLQKTLEKRLCIAQEKFNDPNVRYLDIGKDKFLIEVPVKKFRPTSGYNEFNRTAGCVRLCEEQSKKTIQDLTRLEDQREFFLQNYLRKTILRRYAALHIKILSLTNAIALLDAMNAIACYSDKEDMCCPEIVPHNGKGVFEANGLFYPETKVIGSEVGKHIVPNDICLDDKTGKVVVLTGPNMGGKSTLMRSIADACVLAQIGGFVHARSCRMSPMDRIYTRIGAKDALFQGKSTFLVELTETAHILQKATDHSLVLVDELGRGTSTLDGYAIAWGSLLYLADRNCFTLFSTHYYFLAIEAIVHFAKTNLKVRAMQMQYEHRERDGQVVLMHKLVSGVCSNSYGLDVARQAGIPEDIVQRAKVHGQQMASVLGFDDESMNEKIVDILVEKLRAVRN